MSDLISRTWLLDVVENVIEWDTERDRNRIIHQVRELTPSAQQEFDEWCTDCKEYDHERHCCPRFNRVIRETVNEVTQQWIPVSERLPEDLQEVNITYVNTNPEPYYDFIKGKPMIGAAVFFKHKWYWYSEICADLLAEYGFNPGHELDDAIKVVAWMPLPEPYKEA